MNRFDWLKLTSAGLLVPQVEPVKRFWNVDLDISPKIKIFHHKNHILLGESIVPLITVAKSLQNRPGCNHIPIERLINDLLIPNSKPSRRILDGEDCFIQLVKT